LSVGADASVTGAAATAIPYLKISSAITYTLRVQVMWVGIAMTTEPLDPDILKRQSIRVASDLTAVSKASDSAASRCSEKARCGSLIFLFCVCRGEQFFRNYHGVGMLDDAMAIKPHPPGLAALLSGRSKRWTRSASRPQPKNYQNAQASYERYLTLARVEAQNGNTIGAENYYQYAEHYFRSMRSDAEAI
jgi:hypothetical protein